MEKYDRVVLGENTVNGYKYVKDMLHMFAESEKQSDTVIYRWNCSIDNNLNKPVMPLGSENEIVSSGIGVIAAPIYDGSDSTNLL